METSADPTKKSAHREESDKAGETEPYHERHRERVGTALAVASASRSVSWDILSGTQTAYVETLGILCQNISLLRSR
jgi:hypothetical protein